MPEQYQPKSYVVIVQYPLESPFIWVFDKKEDAQKMYEHNINDAMIVFLTEVIEMKNLPSSALQASLERLEELPDATA